MADALSGLLQGLNQGVQTGLQLYKTVEGEKRARRQEDLQVERLAVEDSRYAQESKRADDKVSTDNDHWDQTFKFNTDKMEAASKLKREELDQRRSIAADTSRRGWASVGQAQRRNDLSEQKPRTGTLNGYVDEVGKAFADPDRGADAGIQLMNDSPAHRMAVVTKFQQLGLVGQVPADVVGRMTIVPAGEGRYAIGVVGDDGKVAAYDPDGADGPQKAITVSQSMLQRAFGGQAAVDAGDAKTSLGQAQENVDNRIAGLGAQATSLSGELATQQDAARGATVEAKTAQAERSSLGQLLRTEAPAGATLPVGRNGQPDTRGVKTLADEEVAGPMQPTSLSATAGPRGGGPASARPTYGDQAREQLKALNKGEPERQGRVSLANMAVENTEQQLASLPGKAATLDNAWGSIVQQAKDLPVAQRSKAIRDAQETFNESPELAARYPLKGLTEATKLYTKDRNEFVDRVVGAVDLKTATDFKGKPEALAGGKANLRAVMLSMPREVQLALQDYSGQAEGAFQKAAQAAADIGKPEAIIYNLYADKLGIDSKATVALMQDKALWSIDDPAKRFQLAARAMDMVKNGQAQDVEAALGKVMMGK